MWEEPIIGDPHVAPTRHGFTPHPMLVVPARGTTHVVPSAVYTRLYYLDSTASLCVLSVYYNSDELRKRSVFNTLISPYLVHSTDLSDRVFVHNVHNSCAALSSRRAPVDEWRLHHTRVRGQPGDAV